jgi:hypothetical protein
MRFCLFFLFVLSIHATVNEPFRFELLSGYRNDHLHWHLETGGSGTLTQTQITRDALVWENGLTIRTIYRDLVLFLGGSYGAFGKGRMEVRYADLSFATDQPHFRFRTHGWAANTSGYFGYAINLTADRTYKVLLIPLFGFTADFEHFENSGAKPAPWESTDAVGATSYTMSAGGPNSIHSTWYGAFIGAAFQIEPGGPVNLRGGYCYNWLHALFRAKYENTVSLFDPTLISETETHFSFRAKGGGSLGHTGWGQIDWLISRDWQTGFGAKIHYYSSNLLETKLHEQSATLSQKLKIRWTSISGWFMISRRF